MNQYLKAALVMALALVLAACGEQSFGNSTQSGSYAGILVAGGEEYVWEGELEGREYSQAAKIGEVLQETPPEVMPTAELSSNFLSKGAEIYRTNEDPDTLLAKRLDGSWDVFRKQPAE